jgi:SAM-dependent methyltransferase
MPFDDFSTWVARVRQYVASEEPKLIPVFDMYANEALFGRRWLSRDIEKQPQGAAILEIGAGLLLLSCQLAREGFSVTALEPTGDGFSAFERIRPHVMECARRDGINYRLLECPVEELELKNCFDLAFSVNVMEHVVNVDTTLTRVAQSLRPNGTYRFTCPNYQFPYEPHFSLPTLFSKTLTEKVLGKAIFNSHRLEEPEAIWNSLNWIGVRQIKRICRTLPGAFPRFHTTMIGDTLERALSDQTFAKRHASWVVNIAGMLVSIGAHRALALVPADIQPIIDCEISVAALD